MCLHVCVNSLDSHFVAHGQQGKDLAIPAAAALLLQEGAHCTATRPQAEPVKAQVLAQPHADCGKAAVVHMARGPSCLSACAARRAAAGRAVAMRMLLAAASWVCRACRAAAVIALSSPVTAKTNFRTTVPRARCVLLTRSLRQVYAVGGGRSAMVAAGIAAGRSCTTPIRARAPCS